MESILQKIVSAKQAEVADKKRSGALDSLRSARTRTSYSLRDALLRHDASGIIAEFKRASPSKGVINATADITNTTVGYVAAGASALSVLTDESFFSGSTQDLLQARAANRCPILRKDFIIDPYQVEETKLMGADVILLIAAILSPEKTADLASQAKSIGLEVLLEIRDASELDRLNSDVDIVGINNRNLDDFSVSLSRSTDVFDRIPDRYIRISESGINSPEKLVALKKQGFKGFLIGEHFMRNEFPAIACSAFLAGVQELESKQLNPLL